MGEVKVAFRGIEHSLDVHVDSTCARLLEALTIALDSRGETPAPHTLKVLVPAHTALQLDQHPELVLSAAGVRPGMRLLVLGSYPSELKAVETAQQAAASLRLPSFEHEAHRAALRRQRGPPGSSPVGRHFFGSFRALPPHPAAPSSAPSSAAALRLLQQLAADPAIAAVMERHGWRVGLLSEMPPEGKVGISAVCVLGYNVNRGQEISLRLRTDDLRGLRKYRRIREVLVHELAHMEWDEHDSNFKALNSQLLQEVAQHEAASAAGTHMLVDSSIFGDDDGHDWLGDELAASTATGRTLGTAAAADTAGSSAPQLLHHLQDARVSAAAAAMSRWQQQQQEQQQEEQQEEHQPTSTIQELPVVLQGSNATDSSAATVGADVDMSDGFDDDPATAAAEKEFRKLGSFEGEEEEQQAQHLAPPVVQQLQQQQEGHGPQIEEQQLQLENLQQQEQQEHGLVGQQQELIGGPLEEPPRPPQQQQQQDMAMHQRQCTAGPHPISAEAEAVAVAPAATAAAATVDIPGSDVVASKLSGAQAMLQQLMQEAASGAISSQQQLEQQLRAVEAVAGVLGNLAGNLHQQRFRRVRLGNPAFQRHLGRFPAAVQLLHLAGFAERQLVWQQQAQQQHGDGRPEPALLYVRDDPGLLWLVLSVVRDQASTLLLLQSQQQQQQQQS